MERAIYFFKRVSILSETTHAAVLPDDRVDDFEGYGGDDIENTIRDLLSGEVDKRGFRCRPGYTYQSILRDCVPSLGVSTSYPSNNLTLKAPRKNASENVVC